MNKIQITITEEEAKNELESVFAQRFDVDVSKVYVAIEKDTSISLKLKDIESFLQALNGTRGKIEAIKTVRSYFSTNLLESKNFVESFSFLINDQKGE